MHETSLLLLRLISTLLLETLCLTDVTRGILAISVKLLLGLITLLATRSVLCIHGNCI